ncbi:MAG TPA: FmdB family zinc ribbon protein [Acidimicrobiales bacterium]|nr:FmdB family zinc ribbon protein [Acidimicrobiales bacterium]
MPKYEYACKSCGEHTEVTQSFSDPPLAECPACGGPVRKVFSPPGIAFKGSGFYRTDNRKRRTEPKTETKTDAAASGSETTSEPAKKEVAASAATAPAASSSTSSEPKPKPKAAEAKTA